MKKAFAKRLPFAVKLCLAAALLLAAVTACFFIFGGIPRLNAPSTERYPVRGVDVSVYQGQIDWNTLAEQGISFAFIKATEGSSSEDPNFQRNWEQARQSGLRVGAYHFFSFDSGGDTQAENFIRAVEPAEGMLPPVVDVELYGQRPVLYATGSSYDRYLAGDYEGYDIWIRNVYWTPRLKDGREWTFWQYTDRARLAGYEGEEPYIDMNVFNGTLEEFASYPEK